MFASAFSRMMAVLIKELIQMRRDQFTFTVMLIQPVILILLFGFAINTNPKQLPTLIHIEEHSPEVRRIVAALKQSDYFDIIGTTDDIRTHSEIFQRNQATFIITFPLDFSRQWQRSESANIIIEADNSDPATASAALAEVQAIVQHALGEWLPEKTPPIQLIVHNHFNPERINQYSIVPGLLGIILTMTMVMITSIAVTRENEQGNMENLLAMPAKPLEVMLGKILPYIIIGLVQTALVLLTSVFLFKVPFIGSLTVLLIGVSLFIYANLALGFTFSTFAHTQIQAIQLTFFFFLPCVLLSGFMFPFYGMPVWAQWLGETLPITHVLRIIRGVMLKGSGFTHLWPDFLAIFIFMILIGIVALKRYRQTLD